MESPSGAVAIITAATDPLGAATARALAARGGRVVLADVQDDKGRALAAALGPGSSYVHAQPGSEGDMHRLVAGTVRRHGRIDALFNYSAPDGLRIGIADLTPEAWDAMLAVLLRGSYLGIHFAVRWMRRQGRGAIVSSACAGAKCAGASHAAAASNAAVIDLTRSVAAELAGSGVRVNCICPRPGQPLSEAAEAAVWLASDAAAGLTGRVLSPGEPPTPPAGSSACSSRPAHPSARRT